MIRIEQYCGLNNTRRDATRRGKHAKAEQSNDDEQRGDFPRGMGSGLQVTKQHTRRIKAVARRLGRKQRKESLHHTQR